MKTKPKKCKHEIKHTERLLKNFGTPVVSTTNFADFAVGGNLHEIVVWCALCGKKLNRVSIP